MDFSVTLETIGALLLQLKVDHDTHVGRLVSHIALQQDLLAKVGAEVPEIQIDPASQEQILLNQKTSEPPSRQTSIASRVPDEQPSTINDSNMALALAPYRSEGMHGLSKWAAMDAMNSSGSRISSRSSEVLGSEHGAEVLLVPLGFADERKKTSFELRVGWTKVPVGSDVFLDEVDSMLVEKSIAAMRESEMRKTIFCGSMKGSVRVSNLLGMQGTRFERMQLPLLNPSSIVRLTWDISGMILIGYDMVAIPIHMCFAPDPVWFTEGMGWLTLCFWTCDIVLALFTGYYEKGELVMIQTRIMQNYFTGWFWVDCVVVVPDWVMKAMGSMSSAAGLGRVLRIARVFRILRLLRLLKLKRLMNIIYDMIDSEVYFILFGLIKLLFMVFIMSHMVACAWFGIGKLAQNAGASKNWLEDVGMTPVHEQDLAWQYLTSLHWSITQFTPASMDIYATNVAERLFSVVILFWALVALSSIIGSVSASMTQLRNMSADENKNFWILRRYLKQKKISRQLTTRIMSYIEFQQASKHNVLSPNEVKLLATLSEQFGMEMAYESISPFLSSHPFFEYMGEDETLVLSVRRLCVNGLKTTSYAFDEAVFSLGDEGRQMYFVKAGSLQYTLADNTPLEVEITSKLWAAEAVLWTAWRHRGYLRATDPSQVLSLCPTKFSEVMHLHPKPWYLGMHYGVDFVNYLNRENQQALTDVIFDADVWVAVIKESDTYVLRRKKKKTPVGEDARNADDGDEHDACIAVEAQSTDGGRKVSFQTSMEAGGDSTAVSQQSNHKPPAVNASCDDNKQQTEDAPHGNAERTRGSTEYRAIAEL